VPPRHSNSLHSPSSRAKCRHGSGSQLDHPTPATPSYSPREAEPLALPHGSTPRRLPEPPPRLPPVNSRLCGQLRKFNSFLPRPPRHGPITGMESSAELTARIPVPSRGPGTSGHIRKPPQHKFFAQRGLGAPGWSIPSCVACGHSLHQRQPLRRTCTTSTYIPASCGSFSEAAMALWSLQGVPQRGGLLGRDSSAVQGGRAQIRTGQCLGSEGRRVELK